MDELPPRRPIPQGVPYEHLAYWPLTLPLDLAARAGRRWTYSGPRPGAPADARNGVFCLDWVAAVLRQRPNSYTSPSVYMISKHVYCESPKHYLIAIARLEAIVEYVGADILRDTRRAMGADDAILPLCGLRMRTCSPVSSRRSTSKECSDEQATAYRK